MRRQLTPVLWTSVASRAPRPAQPMTGRLRGCAAFSQAAAVFVLCLSPPLEGMKWIVLVGGAIVGKVLAVDEQLLVSVETSTWEPRDDPVMGGGSKSNWSLEEDYGVWQGSVTNVSFLGAPGFCAVRTISLPSVDASAYIDGGLVLKVRSSTPEYTGFKLRFEGPSVPRHVNQYGPPTLPGSQLSPFKVPASLNGEWRSAFLPFSSFSYDHSDYTGKCDTVDPDGYQHRCCSDAAPEVCPNSTQLETIDAFVINAEGVEGKFQMDIKEIVAVGSAPSHAHMVV